MTATLAAAPQTAGATSAIKVDDLHKSFGDLEVLKGVSMDASQGDVVSIIGASGSGKSTFLRCINLLELPTSGAISIAGEPIKFNPPKNGEMHPADRKQVQRLRTDLAMVFQSFNLWGHMNVLQNVMEAPVQVLGQSKAEAREKAEAMLQRVGLYEKRDQFPAFLSGGQQQRAAIARALAIEPRAMLFDEPTSALDPELVGEVLKVIRSIADEGRTMILVTHEMAFARDVSSKIMFLHQGLVEEQGPPEQVFKNPTSERTRAFVSSIHN
ncbi:MAG: ATP-binding cassette domain-containing protein [Pseudomonadota bacterium]